ncbi:MAG TPA: hypothetical protein VHD83_24095 [Puia sp.]|nr:hypothetical protein [Puia sp.]
MTIRVTPFVNVNPPPLRIEAIGRHFNINANITDLMGNPLIQVMDNKWLIYKDNVGKYTGPHWQHARL